MSVSYAVSMMRKAQEGFCTQRGATLTKSGSSTGTAGLPVVNSTAWTARAVNQACRIRDKRREPLENIQGGKILATKRMELVLPWNAVISVKDRQAVYRASVTTVLLGATSNSQLLNDAEGIVSGSWVYFEKAGVSALVESISGNTVTLDISVASTRGETVLIGLRGSTAVSAGASSNVQALESAVGLTRNTWLYFDSAAAMAMILGISGSTVTLDRSVASTSREIVLACDVYDIQGHDMGKGHATEVICDVLKLDDGAIW